MQLVICHQPRLAASADSLFSRATNIRLVCRHGPLGIPKMACESEQFLIIWASVRVAVPGQEISENYSALTT